MVFILDPDLAPTPLEKGSWLVLVLVMTIVLNLKLRSLHDDS